MGTPRVDVSEDPGLPRTELDVLSEHVTERDSLYLDQLILEEHQDHQIVTVGSCVSMDYSLNDDQPQSPRAAAGADGHPAAPLAKGKELKKLLVELRTESVAASKRQSEFFTKLFDKQRKLEELLLNGDARPSKDSIPDEGLYSQDFIERTGSTQQSVSHAGSSQEPGRVKRASLQIPVSSNIRSSGNASLHTLSSRSYRSKASKTVSSASATTATSSNSQWQPTRVPQFARSSTRASTRRSTLNTALTDLQWDSSESEGLQSFMERVEKMLQSKQFEYGAAAAIMINAVVMCCECQYQGLNIGFDLRYPGNTQPAEEVWAGADETFVFFDWFFGILFLLEMVVKMVSWRCRYFYSTSGWDADDWDMNEWILLFPRCMWSWQCWNILDCVCVCAFLIDKVATAVTAFGSVNAHVLRSLKMFRLFRLVRLLRFLEHLDHLYIMTTAISGLTSVLPWAMVLLTLMLLTCTLFLAQILHVSYFAGITASDLTKEQLKKHQEMYEYFGTCSRCMLSMFEITLGNWPPVARLLSEEVSEWFTVICLAHKLTIGLPVIGVITGVILQETFKVAQTDDLIMFRQKKLASSILRKKMKTLFEALDQEADGRLTMPEFTAIGEFPEIECWLASLDIETDDLKTLFELIDIDNSGYITLDELVGRIPRIKGSARGIDMLATRQQFQQLELRIPKYEQREFFNGKP